MRERTGQSAFILLLSSTAKVARGRGDGHGGEGGGVQ